MKICRNCGSNWATPEMEVCLACDEELRQESRPCPRSKMGEFNMLRCVRTAGHDGPCNWVVDHTPEKATGYSTSIHK